MFLLLTVVIPNDVTTTSGIQEGKSTEYEAALSTPMEMLSKCFLKKKWVKRKDIFQSQSAFIKMANKAWKESNEPER